MDASIDPSGSKSLAFRPCRPWAVGLFGRSTWRARAGLGAALLALAPALTPAQAPRPPRPIQPPGVRPDPKLPERPAGELGPRRLPSGPWWTPEELERPGAGAFTHFQSDFPERATRRSAVNAYLLTYLSTAVYANYGLGPILGLQGRAVDRLKANNRLFEREFQRAIRPLFIDSKRPNQDAPRFKMIDFNDRQGYDPEALVIGAAEAVFVVFRGTDEVDRARGPFMPEFAEWLKTDFQLNLIAPGDGLRGRVHAGFWNSLSAIKGRIAEQVIEYGGRTKPVWITGHSLGGAHSKLFAGYLHKQHGIMAKGVYAIASPHVGDEAFVSELNGLGPRGTLQRFDFADDPATVFPPSALVQLGPVRPGYSPAGLRVYYDDLSTVKWDEPDRGPLEILGLIGIGFGLPAVVLEAAIQNGTPLKIDRVGSNLCYHYPEWYLRAAFNALSARQRTAMPRPLELPTPRSLGCNADCIERARMSPWRLAEQATKAAVDAARGAAEAVSFTVQSLFSNVTGNAIDPGTYTIRPLRAPGRGLSRPQRTENGSRVNLADFDASRATQRWEVVQVPGGYLLRSDGRFLDVAADSLLADGGRIILWEPNLPFGNHGPNQLWHFYRVGKQRYLLRNVGSGRVLDAANPAESTLVRQWSARNDDTTQVWIVERASR